MPPTNGRGNMNSEGSQGEAGHNQYTQQQQDQRLYQQQNIRMSPGLSSNNAGTRGGGSTRRNEEGDHIPRTIQPTPLFERLVTEEVQELKAYARIIENQNRRLAELERVHGDLEMRLEQECRGRQQLESTLEKREREWSEKFKTLEVDRDHWKDVVQIEKNKNSRLIDQVVRKDQDIHRMLQRKYDNQRDSNHSHALPQSMSIRGLRPPHGERSTTPTRSPDYRNDQHKSPHEILAASGDIEDVRIRNVANLLSEFFNL